MGIHKHILIRDSVLSQGLPQWATCACSNHHGHGDQGMDIATM